jgi:hypothetical protein
VTKLSIKEAMAFQELQRQVAVLAALVEQLVEEQAAQAGRLAALEGAECATCATRRAGDAARQQRRRERHVTEALQHA